MSKESHEAGIGGRFVRGRRHDALQEIEDWVNEGDSDVNKGPSSRVSAQPAKNVTEQKMLQTVLFEMSKQRYNFILHTKWEQKMFMEKQRYKTSVMKDLLKNVDLKKIQSASVLDKSRRPALQSREPPKTSGVETKKNDELHGEKVAEAADAANAGKTKTQKTVTFVTERESLIPDEDGTAADDPPSNTPEQSLEITAPRKQKDYVILLDDRWPVRDRRFIELRHALSENYMVST